MNGNPLETAKVSVEDDLAIWARLRAALFGHTTTKAIAKAANISEEDARDRLSFLHHAEEVVKLKNDCWRPSRTLLKYKST